MIVNKIIKLICDRDYRFLILANHGFYNRLDDASYLKRVFKAKMGYDLPLEKPETFNEKLQWLKLHNHNPEYVDLVDKYTVRKHIEEILGEEYLIPLLGVWDSEEDIDFDELPEQFVMKCNHNSGLGMCICRDKRKLDINKTKRELRKGLRQNYYLTGREWPYKGVRPRIVAEKYMSNNAEDVLELTDYKFFCFDGYVDNVMVCLERNTGAPKFYFFDKEWKLLRINKRGKEAPEGFTLSKPKCMDEMFKLAAKLSVGMPFVRIDLYECSGKVYFGEYTFFPDSGFDPNILPETDKYFGNLIKCEIGE